MPVAHEQVKKIHGLYQNQENTTQNNIQALNNHRIVVSQPCALGGQTVFQIPNDSFLGTIALSFKMSATTANQYLCPQFAVNAVKSLRVRFSGSEEVYLPHKDIFFWQISQCLSAKKQEQYLGCVGKLVPASSPAPTFYLILNLASFSGLSKRINYPSYLNQSPIQLVVEWASLSELVFGSAASSYSPNFTCNLIASQMVPFSDKGVIKLGPNNSYTHHWRRPFSLAPITTTATTDQQTINIQGIPAGLINSILIYAVKTSDEAVGSYQYARPLNNLALLLNGTVLHNYVGELTQDGFNAYDVLSLPNTGGITQALINYNNSGTNAQATVPYYLIMMGANGFPENPSNEDHISNGVSLASQTLQLRFNQASSDVHAIHVVLFLEYKMDIYGNGQIQISPVMD
jgi:hypothetical protein